MSNDIKNNLKRNGTKRVTVERHGIWYFREDRSSFRVKHWTTDKHPLIRISCHSMKRAQ